MNEDRTFLGNGWSFPPALDKDGTPTRMSAYEENIRQSLWTLLSTSPGERVHRYDYGCPVRRYVFEIMDISTQTLLRDEIERAVVMFEPRVDLNRVDFEVDEGQASCASPSTTPSAGRTAAPTWSIPSTSTKAPTSSGL